MAATQAAAARQSPEGTARERESGALGVALGRRSIAFERSEHRTRERLRERGSGGGHDDETRGRSLGGLEGTIEYERPRARRDWTSVRVYSAPRVNFLSIDTYHMRERGERAARARPTAERASISFSTTRGGPGGLFYIKVPAWEGRGQAARKAADDVSGRGKEEDTEHQPARHCTHGHWSGERPRTASSLLSSR